MLRSLLPFLFCCFGAAQALAQTEAAAPSEPRDPVRDAVDAGNYFFRKAFDARDAEAIADLYTEDGRVIAPGTEPATGRVAIAAFWAGTLRETTSVRLETLTVEAAGDLALEEGIARLTADHGGESTARYLVVWKRVGRRWHLHRSIWNAGPTDAAQPGEGPATATPAAAPPAQMPRRPAAEEPAPDEAPGAPEKRT